MNKIAVSTLVWKRPEVFDAFCRNMSALVPKPIVLVAGSPYDGCQEIAEKYGFTYISTENRYLGRKANLSAQLAMNLDVDYVMLTGSDDLISQKMWEYYCNFKGEALGLLDYYFYNIPDGRFIYWAGYPEGYRKGYPIGANKLIRKDVMGKINWMPFNEKNAHPDEFDTDKKIESIGIKMTVVRMEETGGISLDVKNASNISPFRLWKNAKYMNFDETLKRDPYLRDLVKSIDKVPWPTPRPPRRR